MVYQCRRCKKKASLRSGLKCEKGDRATAMRMNGDNSAGALPIVVAAQLASFASGPTASDTGPSFNGGGGGFGGGGASGDY